MAVSVWSGGLVAGSWGTSMDFWGMSPWTDQEDLGIIASLLSHPGMGGVGGPGGATLLRRSSQSEDFKELQ